VAKHDSGAPAVMRLTPGDNVAVALRSLKAGEVVLLDGSPLVVLHAVPLGHKLAAEPIAQGGFVVKYAHPIGTARQAIERGDHVHTHNVESLYLPQAALRR
jgi:altronate dehydratase